MLPFTVLYSSLGALRDTRPCLYVNFITVHLTRYRILYVKAEAKRSDACAWHQQQHTAGERSSPLPFASSISSVRFKPSFQSYLPLISSGAVLFVRNLVRNVSTMVVEYLNHFVALALLYIETRLRAFVEILHSTQSRASFTYLKPKPPRASTTGAAPACHGSHSA